MPVAPKASKAKGTPKERKDAPTGKAKAPKAQPPEYRVIHLPKATWEATKKLAAKQGVSCREIMGAGAQV